MQVSPMTDADVEPVVELWRQVDLVRPWNDPHHDLELARRHPASVVLVGRENEVVVASALVGFEGHRGWMYYLAVAPEWQAQGKGRAMVQAAESWLQDAGAPKVQLMVRTSNGGVTRFYESLGYQRQDVVVLGKWFR